MDNVLSIFNVLDQNSQALLERLELLQNANATLKDSVRELELKLEKKTETARYWKSKYEAQTTATSIVGNNRNNAKAKQQIDKLIQEIDTCLGQVIIS